MTKGREIKDFLLMSWMLPLACTIVGGSLLALGLSYLDYSNYLRSERERLEQLAPSISRRVTAELLLKDNGTLEPVINHLKEEYGLNRLEIMENSKNAALGTLGVTTPIQAPEGDRILQIEKSANSFGSFINLRHFLLALLPTVGLAGFGFFLQRRYLRQHFIEPIEALAETSLGNRSTDEGWPLEIQSISQKLSESFAHREQVIFGQVARGIIHDIRTHINSIHTATQLSEMDATESEKKILRLERLLSACQRNVPKIKDIIDLSLDTSREICLKPKDADVSKTVQQAISNVEEIAKAKGVAVSHNFSSDMTANYDSVQLERVFTNIVKNAIEATDGIANEKSVFVKGIRAGSSIKVSVEDSGSGLKDKTAIFRPLKSTKTHGIGLGLFVSRKIIEAHQGKIVPENSLDLGGAKFTVEIPVKGVQNEL